MKKLISVIGIAIILPCFSANLFADTFSNSEVIVSDAKDGDGDSVMDTTNNAVKVNIVAGSSAGTEYTEGDTDASITGTAGLMEGAGNALVPLQGTVADGQLVNLGANNDVIVSDGAGALNVIVDSSALPSGASTAAKQPALGTAGTASADVITVQGIASMTALKVDGSAVTQPVSGTVTVTDGAGALNVIVDSGTTTVTQGTATSLKAQVFGDDTTQALDVDAAGQLQIDVLTMPTTTVTATNLDVQIGGSDSLTIGTFPDNEPFNLAQVNGTTAPVATAATDTTGAGVLQMAPLYQFDDVATSTVTENRFAHPRLSTRRALLVEGVASGTAIPVSAASGAFASGALASGSIASGAVASGAFASGALSSGSIAAGAIATGATSIAAAEDDASANLDTGVKIFAIRDDTLNVRSGTEGDYEHLHTDANGALWVDLNIAGTAAVSGSGTATGALRVELANNGTGLVTTNPATAANWGIYVEDAAETAGANLDMAGSVRRDTAASSAGTTGDNATINTDALGKLWTTGNYSEDVAHTAADTLTAVATRRIDTAASSSGTSGDYSTLDSSAEGAVWATLTPTTTSGLSVANMTSGDTFTALTNSAQAIKASAGNLYGYYIYNPNSSAVYVNIYNTAAASVTVGTTTPLINLAIPASAGANLMFPYPVTFSNAGWSASCTTTGGGNTAPSTACEAMFFYK